MMNQPLRSLDGGKGHTRMAGFVQRRVIGPVMALLCQGITPRKLACSLACGVVCGIFPVMGTTTLVCACAALLFRLNLPAVQLVNYLIYPLQLALIVPFIRAGEVILRTDSTSLSLQQMIAIFHHNRMHALRLLWRLALHGIVAWSILAPVLFAAVYCIVLPPIARMSRSIAERRSAAVTS